MRRMKVKNILKVALARSDITVERLCHLACIPMSTYCAHLRRGWFTGPELRRISRVLNLSDEEIASIIRG